MKNRTKITAIITATLLALSTTACRPASAPSPEPTTSGGTDRATVFSVSAADMSQLLSNLPDDVESYKIIITDPSPDLSIVASAIKSNNKKVFLDLSLCTGLTSIPFYVFYRCVNMINFSLPPTVTTIEGMAFYGCDGLTKVVIPDTVQIIGFQAFDESANLETVIIGNGVTEINNFAFQWCPKLTYVQFGNSITYIGDNVFYKTNLTGKIRLPEKLDYIGSGAFSDSKVTEIFIPASVTNIDGILHKTAKYVVDSNNTVYKSIDGNLYSKDGKILYRCAQVNGSFSIPNTVTKLNRAACYGLDLTEVIIPNSVTYIGDSTFSGCSKLDNVVLPDTVTYLGSDAFCECSSLKNIVLSSTLTRLEFACFYKCSSLESITIPSNINHIGTWAFNTCPKLTSVTFANPEGWSCHESNSSTIETTFSKTDLQDTSIAAKYLSQDYFQFTWERQ